MPNRWVAGRLGMGHEVGVTWPVRRFRDDRELAERLKWRRILALIAKAKDGRFAEAYRSGTA